MNEVPRLVFYSEARSRAPFLFIQFPFPGVLKAILTIIVIFIMRCLYQPSRIEVQLLQSITRGPLTQIPPTIIEILRDRDMRIAILGILVRFSFWNYGLGKEMRYAPFKTPVLYRVAKPLAPHLCFNGTHAEKSDFDLLEAELCCHTWATRDGMTAVQYVPGVYSKKQQTHSCLSPSGMKSFGRISIDNDTYYGPPNSYVHDVESIWSHCAKAGYNCSEITSVRTSSNGTTWIKLSNPRARRIIIFILLRRPGMNALGQGYRAFNTGKPVEQILKIILSVDLELKVANCYDIKREVPVGQKSSHLYIDTRLLFALVLLECVLSSAPFRRINTEHRGFRSVVGDFLQSGL